MAQNRVPVQPLSLPSWKTLKQSLLLPTPVITFAKTIETSLLSSPEGGSITSFPITLGPSKHLLQAWGQRKGWRRPSSHNVKGHAAQKKAVCGGACPGIRERNRPRVRPGSGRGLTLLLFQRELALVVTVEVASEQKREFGVVLLLLHRHLLKLGPVASHELGQFVDDISKLLVWRTEKRPRGASARTAQIRGPRRTSRRPPGRDL